MSDTETIQTSLANVKPPSKEQIKAHLIAGADRCAVCDAEPLYGVRTDYNGQIRCYSCGTTHQILGSHHSNESLVDIGVTKDQVAERYCDCFEFVPLFRAYRRATGNPIPTGTYLGQSPIRREVYKNFNSWLRENASELRPAWEEHFHWDRLLEKA